RMDKGWYNLPPELLLEIFSHLPTAALVHVTAVCTWWRSVARDDSLWREIFMNEFHSFVSTAPVCDVLADEYGMIKRGCPTTIAEVVEDFYYELENVVFSPLGCFYAVSGKDAMLCVYESTSRQLLEERDLHLSLRWTGIVALAFSPDDMCLAVRGVKANGKEEVATFEICIVECCLHFISRLPSTKCSPWFNNKWILSNDVYPMDLNSQYVKSISHLQLYKRHSSKKEARLEPKTISLMKLLNESEDPFNFLVSPFVSRRFRRIIDMAREAAWEGKTLSSKLNELDLIDQSVNEETQMDKLKQLLDKDERCFKCYITDGCEEECTCSCHVGRDDFMLIYGRHEDEIQSRICFHIVDLKKAIDDDEKKEREQKEGEKPRVEDPTPDDDLYSYLSRQTSAPDHEIILDGRLLHLALSPDYKYLYATVNMSPRSSSPLTEIRSFHLQTMVAERGIFYGGLAPFPNTTIPTAANEYFLFSSTDEQVVVWSRVHHGPSLTRLTHPNPVRSIAAHPQEKLLLVVVGEQLHVWTPAFAS
ncbi:hypothetical protein PRIPAC_73794, partial [Pristionchus pacificus]